jgi:TRAP-type C4-dicarboxylate transport system substrate-binding protein
MRHTLLASALSLTFLATPAAAQTTLKIATLAPEGSSWMKLFHEWQGKVEARTAGRVKIKFYAGGMMGDERDVLRKIRLGQISGAAITGIGLAAINPEVRALEIARTYEELDALRAELGDQLKKKFEEKGFLLASWGDVGPIHLFSAKPVKSMDDMKQLKIWLWSDDPVSKQLFEGLGIHGVPMGVPDVLPGLSTGQIDSFFGSPLSTLALQWGTHVKFMTSQCVGMATGATVVAKTFWDKLSPEDQKILQEEGAAMQGRVLKQVRDDNARALAAMKAKGLQVVETPPALAKELERRGEAVARAAGQNLSKDFTTRVEKLVNDYRAKRKN